MKEHVRVVDTSVFAGMPFTPSVKESLEKSYPGGTISFTRGPSEAVEEEICYLVRAGKHAVIMPRMKYSESVEKLVASS